MEDYKIFQSIVTLSVEKALLEIGVVELDLVKSKLQTNYNCEISDCLSHPEYLKEVLTIGYFNLSIQVDDLDDVNIDIEFSDEQDLPFPDTRVSPARFIKFGFFES